MTAVIGARRAKKSVWDLAADILDPQGGVGLWTPWPKQRLASDLAHRTDELLFGGAAGPGKTEWLIRYGIEQMETYPGNRGIIFRRVFPSLQRTIIPRAQEVLANGRARWNENKKTFTFPNGSILEVGSLQYLNDIYDYQGAEYGWIGWEEITEFLQEQYEYLLGRLRTPSTFTTPRLPDGSVDQSRMLRPHSVATTNPGGVGHAWVKRRWVKPKEEDIVGERPKPLEIWRPRPDPTKHDEENPPQSRVFIPAVHTDNPALLERDPGYLSRLREQSNRGIRKALEEGDWDAIDQIEGALWSAVDLDLGRVSPGSIYKTRKLITAIAVDPSDGDDTSDEYGVAAGFLGADQVGYVTHSYGWKTTPKKMAKLTSELYHDLKADMVVVERNHGGRWMLQVLRDEDPNMNIVDVWASDGKKIRAKPVAALFEQRHDLDREFRARIVGFHEELEEELTHTTFKKGEPSPNKLDALVWLLSKLMINPQTGLRGEYRDERLRGRR